MYNGKERIVIENEIINGMMLSKTFLEKVYDFNPNVEDLFKNEFNRQIFSLMINKFTENQILTSAEIYNHLILHGASDEAKKHLTQNITSTDPIFDITALQSLIEDSIEAKIKQEIASLDKRKIKGLDYAQELRENVDKIILEKFECYKHDNRSNKEKVIQLLSSIQKISEGKASDYLPTGYPKLDSAIIGLPKGHVSIIAARPGMGKTSFMLQLKRNLVMTDHKPLIISIEMNSEQLLTKDLSALTKIDSRKIESGNLNSLEKNLIDEKALELMDDNFVIEDDAHWTVEKIKATIRRKMIKDKIDCVFIDYLTLIRTPNKSNRYDLEIGEITNSLREFAKETNLPIVILSQLNRQVESRTDKRPQLSDLRESGSIEQDAKTVIFLYNAAHYQIVSEYTNSWADESGETCSANDFCEIIIAKCRNGLIGTIPLKYEKPIHTFSNLVKKNENDNIRSENYSSIKSLYQEKDVI